MIELPRGLARRFRAVLRQSLMAQEQRSSWPLLLVRSDQAGLTLQAWHGDLAVRYYQPEPAGTGAIAFRSDLLAQFEGRHADKVKLDPVSFGKGTARWEEAGIPRMIEFETVVPESVPDLPTLPKQLVPFPGGLQALAEAGQTTARGNVRFALARIQLRGKTGEVIGTDGRQLLVQRGMPFPWPEDILVPRVPVFGSRELAGETIEVGRTDTHVAVRAGSWTFLLTIDSTSRYPNVFAIIPRKSAQATRLHIDPKDAGFLMATLPKLPGRDDEHFPITLDLGTQIAVRARDAEQERNTEVVLAHSTVSGPTVRLSMDRHYLLRMLKLGLTELQVTKADKPVLAMDQARAFVWMPLEGEIALPPGKNMQRLVSTAQEPQVPTPSIERKEKPMPAPQPNGRSADNNGPQPLQPERCGIEEIITEAEALRTLLQEAGARVARLLAALKQQRRQSRAVLAAMASLRHLQLER